jgi:recombinational DNA repair protein RecR
MWPTRAVTHDDSYLSLFQYCTGTLEEEDAHRALADVCRSHARDIAPVIILQTTHDAIIDNLGQLSDRYVILKKTEKVVPAEENIVKKTLDDWESLHTSQSIQRVQQYGQQTLPEDEKIPHANGVPS